MATTKKPAAKKAVTKKAAPKAVKEVAAPKVAAPVSTSEATIFDMKGAHAGSIALPAEIFAVKWNSDLVHQVVTGIEANKRTTTANTKFRGEVAGGGKKPWKQKGTGRARHGSTRSPIWKGGGITHGPRKERDYSVKINKKMRRAALLAVISRKMRDGEIIFIDKLAFAAPSTSSAKTAFTLFSKAAGAEGLVTKKQNAALVAFAAKDANAEKSIRNLGNIVYDEVRNLNAADLLSKKYLIIERPTESIAILSGKLAK
jgi:large subunit ribosomal protein L4